MHADQGQSIAVVGAGAVGCYFGGMLARSGVRVTLIGRAKHMDAIARDGLLIRGPRVNERVPVAATTSLEQGVRGADTVLLSVKTTGTESTAREMQPHLAPNATILSFQNGVDNAARIQSAIGVEALPVAVYVAAEMTAPDCVTHIGRGDLVIDRRGSALAAMFEAAKIPCRIVEDIAPEMWTKMVMNCAYNAISALTRTQYGRIAQFEPARELMRRAIAETVAVARAEGTQISEPAMVETAFALGEKMSGATSSTAQDIARGRLTEIDSLNGFVSRRGAALGVATPVSDALVALVKMLEESAANRRSG